MMEKQKPHGSRAYFYPSDGHFLSAGTVDGIDHTFGAQIDMGQCTFSSSRVNVGTDSFRILYF